MKVLVYRKCSTCMKALKWLDEHNINYEERAIKEENPTYEELKKWYAKSSKAFLAGFYRKDIADGILESLMIC